MMKQNSWPNQYKNCWRSKGVLLSFYDNPAGEIIAEKLMTAHDVKNIFLGMQKNSDGTKWQSDWYLNIDTDYEISEDGVKTFIKNHVAIASLNSGTFSFTSADGYKNESAICEFGNFISNAYTTNIYSCGTIAGKDISL